MDAPDSGMVRPSVPAADALIGVKHSVLSHGYVVLVDYMGNDAAIVQAARVSYGAGTKTVRDDRALIRYLMRHRHTTPFEMVEFKFLVRLPIYVARQWIRHRTACLAEGTRLHFDLPGGIRLRGNQLYPLRIEELYRKFQPTRNRIPSQQRNPYFKRDRIQAMRLRYLDSKTRRFGHSRLVTVAASGTKPVVRMVLADGKKIDCTPDHRFLFSDGWKSLAEGTGLEIRDGLAVWDRRQHFVHVNGGQQARPTLYRDPDWLEEQYIQARRSHAEIGEVCGVAAITIRKWTRAFGLHRGPGFQKGLVPWNKGKTYRFGHREFSPSSLVAIRAARSGRASNFWKGGLATDRESIGRWTTQRAHAIHERNGWTCQLCGLKKDKLHAHHIVPVWADPNRARDERNLTTLCSGCHHRIHLNELAFVERLGGAPVKAPLPLRRKRVGWNRLTVPRLVRIERFEYVGERMTYDAEVASPDHNFVANGIVTHNSVNEYSARYSIVPDEFDLPDATGIRRQSSRNRQGRDESLAPETVEKFRSDLKRVSSEAYRAYTDALDAGVARETARLVLPLAFYTEWYWKIDLYNLLHFLSLRLDPHAQEEIRLYAGEIAGIARAICPAAYEAFQDFVLEGASFSRKEQRALAALLRGATPEGACAQADLPLIREDGRRMTSGEGVEFLEKLERLRVPP